MGFTRSTTTTNVHSTLGDYPSVDDGLTPTQLKARFDAPATGLKSDLNGLMGELEATTSAANIGAGIITSGDTSPANVQAKLTKIYEDLQNVALEGIPDDSITSEKLAPNFRNSLAIKNGETQTNLDADTLDGEHGNYYAKRSGLGVAYLASKYRTPSITNATTTNWSIPALTSSSHTGYYATYRYNSNHDVESAYSMFNGNGNSYITAGRYTYTSEEMDIIIQLPKPTRITGISFKGDKRANLNIYGSNDTTLAVADTKRPSQTPSLWTKIGTVKYSGTTSYDIKNYSETLSAPEFYTVIRLFQNEYNAGGESDYNSFSLYNNIVLTGKTVPDLNRNTMSITASDTNEVLSAYQEGQVVKIKTPSNFIEGKTLQPTLNIYGLGAKNTPQDMKPSTRYSLVYNGTSFEHEF